MKDDVISRQAAIIQLSHNKNGDDDHDVIVQKDIETIKQLPSAQPEIIRCKDCMFGHLYLDVHNETDTDSWVECVNPDGLNRDVSCDGYCSAAIRRKNNEDD